MFEIYEFNLLAAMINIISIGVIYWDWKYLKRHNLLVKLTGWTLLLVALWLWGIRNGWEFGTVFWLIASALSAWLFILIDCPNKGQPQYLDTPEKLHFSQFLTRAKVIHIVAKILMVFVVALVACCLFSVALIPILPGSEANILVFVSFFFPLAWALTSYWICATKQLRTPLISLTIISAASSLLLFL